MRAAPVFASLAVVAALVPGAAPAQVQAGQRLRIQTSAVDTPVIGTLVRQSADTLFVQTPEGAQPVGVRTIRRIDVSQGMGHAGRRGAAIGAAVGAVLGAVGGAASYQRCSDTNTCFFNEPLPEILGGTIAAAALGAGVGFLIGATQRSERWKRVALDVAVTPARVQISLSF